MPAPDARPPDQASLLTPSTLAVDPPTVPLVAVDVFAAIFHDPLDMCHWSGCSWPWNVPGNFEGECEGFASPNGEWTTSRQGVWQELHFDVQVPGGGATLSRAGIVMDRVGFGDPLALTPSVAVRSALAQITRGTA